MFAIIKNQFDKKASREGYSLIEVAIIMIIIGVLIAPLGAAYSSYMKKKAFEVTDRNMSMVTTTVGAFRAMNGRYPCPASLTATRDDSEYGRESDCADTSSIAIGSCQDGICIKESARTLPSGAPIRVRVGALPFRQLNLSEDYAYDGYGHRLTYVLTESLGDQDTFKLDEGGIGVIDTQTPPVSLIGDGAMANSAHFLLLSHGPNGAGGYLENGDLAEACLPVEVMEGQNCDTSTNTAIYRQSEYSTANGIHYFDDTVSYFVRGEITPWLVDETNPADIYFKDLSLDASVGIDASDMTADEKNKVNSIVRARESAKTTQLCGQGGVPCTPASAIAGDPDAGTGGMKCPAGEFMVAISNNGPECKAEIFDKCATGKVVTGIDSNGKIICGNPPVPPVPPKACATRTVSLCSTNHSLLAGPHGTTRTITAGVSRVQNFICDNGTWRSQSTSGLCTCQTVTESRNQSCGTGYNGGIYQTRTYTCPAGVWTAWTTTTGGNTCQCVGATESRTQACPAEYTGGISQQRTYTCTSATTGTWSGWATIPNGNTCACSNKTESRTLACESGLTGNKVEQRNFSCATSQWSSWTQTSSSCACVARPPETRTQPCPSGYTGNIYEARNFQCPSATWTGWTETSRDCKVVPVPVCSWEPTGSGLDQTTKRGSRVGDQCTCGASGQCHEVVGGGLYYNYNSCSCQ